MTTLKPIHYYLFICILTLSGPILAQEPKKVEEKQDVQLPKLDFELAAIKFEKSVQLAIASFKEVNKPDEEKIKEFDELIELVRGNADSVAKDGEMNKLVGAAVKRAMDKANKWALKARKPGIGEVNKVVFLEASKDFEEHARKSAAFMVAIVETRDDLEKQLRYIRKHKELYVDMIEIKQLERANKALEMVIVNMNGVSASFAKLGRIQREIGIELPVRP